VSKTQHSEWDDQGFFILRGFADSATVEAMERAAVDIARRADAGEDIADAIIVKESALTTDDKALERQLSKIFRVHRHEKVFHEFVMRTDVLDTVADILGEEIDCFLSQFIFKLPGALGQPWHQDSYYFAFDRGPQVGLWLAVTEATLENGPLWVLPGSHREPIHKAEPDEREHAGPAYVEIRDHDFSGEICVPMAPGDLLVFHSHLMHRSTDNESSNRRAAMVYHFGEAATVDQSLERRGHQPRNIDWMPVRREPAT
jgi:ectoine hydroxylase-related dioxygenase (phytanoyl-CoA dioxygenase family)